MEILVACAYLCAFNQRIIVLERKARKEIWVLEESLVSLCFSFILLWYHAEAHLSV